MRNKIETKKYINIDEHKTILKNIFEYINEVCRQNNIKYSLIGGSLIGAVRNGGIIPWDDDIDIILTKPEYDRLIEVLKGRKGRYIVLTPEDNTYRYPFAKVVDSKTELVEPEIKKIDNYGVFIDVFYYVGLPEDNKKAIKYINKMKKYKKLLTVSSSTGYNEHFIKRFVRIIIGKIFNYKKVINGYIKYVNKYPFNDAKKVISVWPVYKPEKEIIEKKWLSSYTDILFENISSSIFSDYDDILKTTFGNYMTPPPEEKRVSHHNMVAYWREK